MTELVIAQLPMVEKENEMTAIPKLLELLDIKDSMITIDAIGTTQAIIETIEKQEGHYLLPVKKSNPLTYEELKELFENLEQEISLGESHHSIYEEYLRSYERYETNEKNRGRMEYRQMSICQKSEILTRTETIPGIKTIGWLRQVRIPIEKDEEGNDITPDRKTFLEKGTVRRPKVTVGDVLRNFTGAVVSS